LQSFVIILYVIAGLKVAGNMLSNQFTLTKRHLGLLLLLGGIFGFAAILGIDILDVGREGGIGPAQRIALDGCVLMALVGITLIPLGDQPA